MEEHEQKNFKEAIEAFKKSAMIHPFDENHLQCVIVKFSDYS